MIDDDYYDYYYLGRQFDKDGNLIQWWDDIVIQKFKERAQCIIDQYNNYTVPGLNINVRKFVKEENVMT